MTENGVLLPAEAAERLGVSTRVIINAMHDRQIPRVKLPDGTLGIPADALTPSRPRPVNNDARCDEVKPTPMRCPLSWRR
jgi:hypothetical protein